MNCKVINGFDLLLSKTFHCLLLKSTDEFKRKLALARSFSLRGFW